MPLDATSCVNSIFPEHIHFSFKVQITITTESNSTDIFTVSISQKCREYRMYSWEFRLIESKIVDSFLFKRCSFCHCIIASCPTLTASCLEQNLTKQSIQMQIAFLIDAFPDGNNSSKILLKKLSITFWSIVTSGIFASATSK